MPEKKPLSEIFNHSPEKAARLAAELLAETAKKDADLRKVLLLIQQGAPLDAKDELGCTPLILAAFHGHTEIAAALVRHGAALDETTRDHYDFIPHMHGRLTDMNDFSGSVSALEEKSVSRATALATAAARGHAEIVRILVAAGAKKDGALERARDNGHTEIAALLSEKSPERPPAAPRKGDGREPNP